MGQLVDLEKRRLAALYASAKDAGYSPIEALRLVVIDSEERHDRLEQALRSRRSRNGPGEAVL